MSLDVYLTTPTVRQAQVSGRIFVRDGGSNREISRQEWDELNPGIEPVTVPPTETNEVFSRNITHNLGKMAGAAGIYKHLWRPDEIGATKAAQLVEPLRDGLALLESDPGRFKALNPSNGWGDYEGLVDFVREYLKACEQYPDADVGVSR